MMMSFARHPELLADTTTARAMDAYLDAEDQAATAPS